jgi:hypothetical protein
MRLVNFDFKWCHRHLEGGNAQRRGAEQHMSPMLLTLGAFFKGAFEDKRLPAVRSRIPQPPSAPLGILLLRLLVAAGAASANR